MVTVQRNHDSVPVRLAALRVRVRVGAREIVVVHDGQEVARQPAALRAACSACRTVAGIPSRYLRMVWASLTNGLSLDRDAQASQASRCSVALAGSGRW